MFETQQAVKEISVQVLEPMAAALVGPEFNPVTGEWQLDFEDERQVKDFAARMKLFAPPGHALVFNACLLPKVPGLSDLKAEIVRVLEGWRIMGITSSVIPLNNDKIQFVNYSNMSLDMYNFEAQVVRNPGTGQVSDVALRTGRYFSQNIQGLLNYDPKIMYTMGLDPEDVEDQLRADLLVKDILAKAHRRGPEDPQIISLTRALSQISGYGLNQQARWQTARQLACLSAFSPSYDGRTAAGIVGKALCAITQSHLGLRVNEYAFKRFDKDPKSSGFINKWLIKSGIRDNPNEGHTLYDCSDCPLAPNCVHLADHLKRNPQAVNEYSMDYVRRYFTAFYEFLDYHKIALIIN